MKGATSGGKGKHYRDKYRNGGRGQKSEKKKEKKEERGGKDYRKW